MKFLESKEAQKREWHGRLAAERAAERSGRSVPTQDQDFVPLPRARVAPRTLHRVVAERRAREASARRSIVTASIASLLFISSLGFAFTDFAPIASTRDTSNASVGSVGSFFAQKFASLIDSVFAFNDDYTPPALRYPNSSDAAAARSGDTYNTTNNNYVTNNNYIQTGTAASGGISERLFDAKLDDLENYLDGRIDLALYESRRQTEDLADQLSGGIGGGGFDDIDITDSTFTGGSISGTSLSGVSFSDETTFSSLTTAAATE